MHSENSALAKYDLSDYRGLQGKNLYRESRFLQRVIERYCASLPNDHVKRIQAHLEGYGELCGGILNQLTEACHKEGKYGEIINYSKTGERIEEIQYSPEQLESRRISYEYGVVNLDCQSDWPYEFHWAHRYALAFLMNLNGEGGVSCPLAMTEGLIYALREIGTEEQKERYLPMLTDPKSTSWFMAGQYVTERVGGSNVAANRTIARKVEGNRYILQGEKWFCSNPGDLWVTTARLEGSNTIGLFLVPRIKRNGELNGFRLVRKKDIIGSKGKVTAEVIYDQVEAEALGRPAHGLANLIRYIINVSRLHVAIGAAGNSHRAVLEIKEYARWRTAYGKKLMEIDVFANEFADLNIEQNVLNFTVFRYLAELNKNSGVARNLLAPLMKFISSSKAGQLTHRAILCMGGNGILGDFSILPRLHNDAIINETWEGTHLLLTGHIISALLRPRIQAEFFELLEQMTSHARSIEYLQPSAQIMDTRVNLLRETLSSYHREQLELNRIPISEELYNVFALAEMLEQAGFDQNPESEYVSLLEGWIQKLTNPGKTSLMPNLQKNTEHKGKILQY
ncbi:MAG: acyl-CoA dehydrogenase family protein [Leptospiraceae bacterium]|nr:acyl-CoA dehydrogenase family protein [Leptospiraceae bacterium]